MRIFALVVVVVSSLPAFAASNDINLVALTSNKGGVAQADNDQFRLELVAHQQPTADRFHVRQRFRHGLRQGPFIVAAREGLA